MRAGGLVTFLCKNVDKSVKLKWELAETYHVML